ncbi:3-deoxy-7-phosphoheptulonate synthase [Erysipelotrichaceae bacterium]|nr:3-deoxy-7-phosphoheptulonate synthase [Erysipelotrichaceae bacterium]
MTGETVTILGVLGNTAKIDVKTIRVLDGVSGISKITAPYKLVSREYQPENSIIKVGNIEIGGGDLVIMAGPCSVESAEQLHNTAKYIKDTRANILRGGIVKPRTSPYAFQGLEEKGLELMEAARIEFGFPIVCELMTIDQIERFGTRLDMIQIGARNMQNFDLLKACGKVNTPILLKRGLSATIEEWLMSAEYIAASGNKNIVLCERGIRTFETAYRNVTDLNAIPFIKSLTHLPIIVDSSHSTGIDWMAEPVAKAALAVGADGLMLETHYNPEIALSDGPQSLDEQQFKSAMTSITRLYDFLSNEK